MDMTTFAFLAEYRSYRRFDNAIAGGATLITFPAMVHVG